MSNQQSLPVPGCIFSAYVYDRNLKATACV